MPGGFINGGFNIGRTMFPVPFGAFSPAARDYFARLDAAGLRVGKYDAANARLIDRLVANGGNFWPDSGAFCAMAGYLYPGNGADLTPLKDGHDAGTLNNFVTGNWNAVTGLIGVPASLTHVSTNRMNNTDGQNDTSIGVYFSTNPINTSQKLFIGSTPGENKFMLHRLDVNLIGARINSSAFESIGTTSGGMTGLVAVSRDNAASFLGRANGVTTTRAITSVAPGTSEIRVFNSVGSDIPTDARLPFYHIGPNLNGAGELAELDAALTEWKNALASA